MEDVKEVTIKNVNVIIVYIDEKEFKNIESQNHGLCDKYKKLYPGRCIYLAPKNKSGYTDYIKCDLNCSNIEI